ncbi:Ribose-5-phosphate isomerase A [Tetrabaena socialis]|uniref:ribose-5-phosphate isomerase n=1 Tax=Tetrabaena socialis TaxID=47790 RepID=A0A2J8A2H8_9CHLO|nr:Ribose-5-phosphate isomerase A [Tetrabaena socialis]|eukprot:PNH06731.1 Ribose-5-phosphate isomerase A [Tetrabaena socialis]
MLAQRCRPTCSAPLAGSMGRRAAALTFVDRFVPNGTVLGLGPGDMSTMVIQEVGRRLASGSLKGVSGVPACDVAAHEAAFHGVPLLPESSAAQVLVADADMLDADANAALLGCTWVPRQPDIPRLLAVAAQAPRLVLLTDSSRVVKRLNGALPVWLDAEGWEESAEELVGVGGEGGRRVTQGQGAQKPVAVDDIFLGDAELWRRPSSVEDEQDPRGGDYPYVSASGHSIVDIRFYEGLKLYGEDEPYGKIVEEMAGVVGLVAHGLVIGRAAAAVVARPGDQGPQVIEFA